MSAQVLRRLLVPLSYVVGIFLSGYFGDFYDYLAPGSIGGSFIGSSESWTSVVGYPLSIVFFVTFSLTALGGKNKWWWIGIAMLPAILFEIFIDPLHLYVPIILAVVAWQLGTLAHKALQKLAPGVMAKIGA